MRRFFLILSIRMCSELSDCYLFMDMDNNEMHSRIPVIVLAVSRFDSSTFRSVACLSAMRQ